MLTIRPSHPAKSLTGPVGSGSGIYEGLMTENLMGRHRVTEILGALKAFPLESNASKRANCSANFSDIAGKLL